MIQSSLTQIKTFINKLHPKSTEQEITIKPLSGLTNTTFCVLINQEPLYILKYFAPGFNRLVENQIIRVLAQKNIAVNIIQANEYFRLQEFIKNGDSPTLEDVHLQIKQIMEEMHKYHLTNIPQLCQNNKTHQLLSKSTLECIQSYEHFNEYQNFNKLYVAVKQILINIDKWENIFLSSLSSGIVKFCHNDINLGNILKTPQRIYLIDYEYSDYNYVAYDIANFLNEICFDYALTQFPLFKLLKKVTAEEIRTVTKLYPNYYEGLELHVLKCLSICNLYWAVWSIKVFDANRKTNFGAAEHGLTRIQLFYYYLELEKDF